MSRETAVKTIYVIKIPVNQLIKSVKTMYIHFRETSDIHVLTCVVTDTGLLHSDSTQLHIQISDISDTPPVFLNTPYLLDLSDSTQIGKVRRDNGMLMICGYDNNMRRIV